MFLLSPLKSNSMDTAWHMRPPILFIVQRLANLLAIVMNELGKGSKKSGFLWDIVYITSVCAYHPLLSCQCLFYFREYLSEMDVRDVSL